jgi:copper chaperone
MQQQTRGEIVKKRIVLMMIVGLIGSASALADGTQYQMRVDGLACPYCAYGVEKNLKKIDGVEKIEVDLNNGLVTVDVASGVTLTDAQMAKLFTDAGFTYRSMLTLPLDEVKTP